MFKEFFSKKITKEEIVEAAPVLATDFQELEEQAQKRFAIEGITSPEQELKVRLELMKSEVYKLAEFIRVDLSEAEVDTIISDIEFKLLPIVSEVGWDEIDREVLKMVKAKKQ